MSKPTVAAATHKRPAWVSIYDWSQRTGMGRTKTFELIGAGSLRAKKLGSKLLIDFEHGLAFIDSLPDAQVRDFGRKQAA